MADEEFLRGQRIERAAEPAAVTRDMYAVVHHSRWLETEEPKATVIYSRDGRLWHDICTCDPEWANEIAVALRAYWREHNGE